jgi:hypothetical protein
MGYMTAQGLLKSLLLTNANFGTNDVTEGDLSILDSGIKNAAVLFPASLVDFDIAGMVRSHTWEGFIDLYTKFEGDGSYSAFGVLRDSVVATLDAEKCLNETYFMTAITSESDPVEVYDKLGGGPFFIWQRLRLSIDEQV